VDRDPAFLGPLSHDRDLANTKVHVVKIKAAQFSHPQSSGIQQLDDDLITNVPRILSVYRLIEKFRQLHGTNHFGEPRSR
jgi:hypothetical protein